MALVFVCSILGMCGASFFLHSKLTYFDAKAKKAMGIVSARQLYMTQMDDNVFFGYYLFLTGSETFLVGFAQIMILHRLIGRVKTSCPKHDVSVKRDDGGEPLAGISSQSLLYLKQFFRAVSFLLLICSVSGFVNMTLAVLHFGRMNQVLLQAAQECDEIGRDTNASKALSQRLYTELIPDGNALPSYVVLSKVVLLFVVIFAYIFIGFYCISMLRSARQEIAKSVHSLDVFQNNTPQQGAHSASSASEDIQNTSSAVSNVTDRSMLESSQQEALKQERRLIIAFHLCLWTILPRLAHDIMYEPSPLTSTLNHCYVTPCCIKRNKR